MKLFENPIFLTQKRLIHRAGVVAPVFVVLLIGLSMLASLGYELALGTVVERSSIDETGRAYYAWLLVVQALVLVVGGFSRISRTLVEERRAGLLDSNRLTPLPSRELVMGYWLGGPLREFYMAASLAPVGLAIVLMARLPLGLWVGTQMLLLTTGLLFGLLGVLAGMAMPRAQGGVGLFVGILLVLPNMLAAGRLSLTNFLVPVYAAVELFHVNSLQAEQWNRTVELFSLSIHPLVYTLTLQVVLAVMIWRGAVRKLTSPTRPAFLRWEVLTIFALLVFLQYGLIWSRQARVVPWRDGDSMQLAFVHGGALLVGIVILAAQVLSPEEARIVSLRLGHEDLGRTLWRSAPCTALALAAIASAGLWTQFRHTEALQVINLLLVSLNTVIVYVTFAMLLELSRLEFRRRATGFFVLGVFVFYGLPFLISATLLSSEFMKFSFLSPGFAALANPDVEDVRYLGKITIGHYAIAAALLYFWVTRWQCWLSRAVR